MAVMTYQRPPPARKSLELTETSKPDGPHLAEKPSAVVQSSQTAPTATPRYQRASEIVSLGIVCSACLTASPVTQASWIKINRH